MKSYLTQDEIDALQTSKLSRDTPFAIRHVLQTQFSIARFYGGATYNGKEYTYFPESEELIRDDVLKWIRKRRKQPQRTNP